MAARVAASLRVRLLVQVGRGEAAEVGTFTVSLPLDGSAEPYAHDARMGGVELRRALAAGLREAADALEVGDET
jgi:hypothetical protein